MHRQESAHHREHLTSGLMDDPLADPAAPSSRKPTTVLQFYAAVLAHICALASLILGFVYCGHSNKGDDDVGFLGGFNWRDKTFNWHPCLMITGLIFCSTEAILAFRTWAFGRAVNKALHACFTTLAVGFTTVGLVAVFLSHNSLEHSAGGVYTANLYSAHSWIGISTVSLFYFQWVMGIVAFLLPSPEAFKDSWMPLHIFLGTSSYIGAAVAVGTGIAEKTSWMGIGYDAGDKPVLNPAEHYLDIGRGFRVALWCCFFVFLTVIFAMFAVNDTAKTRRGAATGAKHGEANTTDLA